MQDYAYPPHRALSELNARLSLENQRLTSELASVQSFRKNQTATIEGYQRKTQELQIDLAYARRLNVELRQRNEELRQRLQGVGDTGWQERRAGLARYGLIEALRCLRRGCPEHAKGFIERALIGTRVVRRG